MHRTARVSFLALAAVSAVAVAADPIDDATAADGLYAVFETTLGSFACRLEPEKAPVTVGNFVGLAAGTQEFIDARTGQRTKRPFYDGLRFHRVVSGFVVQAGCPRGDGTGGPGYEFVDEIDPSLRHDGPGVLSMASAGRDRNGSQFFITLAAAPHLDDRQSVFGRVVAGMDVLESMTKLPRMGLDRTTPVSEILIRKVRVIRTGDAARAFDAAAAFALQAEVRVKREAAQHAAWVTFHAQLEQDRAQAVRTASGLLYVVLAPGSGDAPKPGDTAVTHCTGWLEKDGTRFWSTRDGGQPFRIKVGTGKVIKAWEEAFLEMRPGEKRRLIVPPELGYGAQGNVRAGIPGNTTLVFDVELVDIERH